MESILEVPTGSVATIMAPLGVLFTDLWMLIAIAIGIPLAFYIIYKVVALVRSRA
jgi:hypothetical protein